MTTEIVFQLSNVLVLPFWILLIGAPHWKVTRRIFDGWLFIVPITLLYSIVVLPGFVALLPTLMNPSLAGISALLSSPTGATAAWIHFLAFDLWTGRWVFHDSQSRPLHPLLRACCLLAVFMAGPFGLLLYLSLRAATGDRTDATDRSTSV
ncbi:MAG: hypothetical protein RLZZ297_1282 [Chloroflexota bacterium]|jgi:hypothetical protein